VYDFYSETQEKHFLLKISHLPPNNIDHPDYSVGNAPIELPTYCFSYEMKGRMEYYTVYPKASLLSDEIALRRKHKNYLYEISKLDKSDENVESNEEFIGK